MQTAGISADLLTPNVRHRFVQLFGVAARKSVLPWKEVPRDRAQLVLVDQGMADVVSSLGNSPCVVTVGNVGGNLTGNASWAGRLEVNYTLSDLIDTLDRAAVFLLDWEARQKVIARSARAQTQVADAAPAAKQEYLYQLKSWVSMGAPFNTGACIRALALLSREPISLAQLCTHREWIPLPPATCWWNWVNAACCVVSPCRLSAQLLLREAVSRYTPVDYSAV